MHLEVALYDLDNTLYPHASGLMEQVNERIVLFVQQRLQVPLDQARILRRSFYERYGTTLMGLQREHGPIDQEEYLRFVHDISLDAIDADQRLDAALRDLPLQKVIFTNSPLEHATRVLQRLGLTQHFSHLVDIRALQFLSKPHDEAYQTVLRMLNVAPQACVLFEDTHINLRPAKALGMTTVLITDSINSNGDFAHADYLVPNVLDATILISDLVQNGHMAKPPVTSSTAPLT